MTYTCKCCGDTFDRSDDWSDEDAEEELHTNFPGFTVEDCAVVCDDCYKEFFHD